MKPPGFEIAPCSQGSTLRDVSNQQTMHSSIGPTLEAELIFVGPSGLREKLQESSPSPLILWDVGMGIAGNSTAAWKLAFQGSCRRPLEIHSFEKHPEALSQALANLPSFPHLEGAAEALTELLHQGDTQATNSSGNPHRWILHSGDFQETLRRPADRNEIPSPDLIFWDFYSPKALPELWSLEVFEALFRLSPRSTFVTYSAATPVRLGLLLAGFWVGRSSREKSATPMKSESTIAVSYSEDRAQIPELLDGRWLDKLSRSTQFRPYGQSYWSLAASFDEVLAQVSQLAQFRGLSDHSSPGALP